MLFHYSHFLIVQDIIAMLFKKAYDFANDETGYNLTVDSSAQVN